MNTRIILMGLLFLSSTGRAESLVDAWRLERQTGNVWVWRHQSHDEIIGTLQSQRRAKAIQWRQIQSKDFFMNLATKKRQLLNLIGISSWNASDYSWSVKEGRYELTINGNYTNSGGQRTHFKEVHLFKDLVTYQILFTAPQSVTLKQKLADEFINNIKTMVLKNDN